MADKSIVELGIAQQMTDDALLPVYQGGETKSIEGALIKQYAKDSVRQYVDGAKQSADEAAVSAAAAKAAREGVEAYAEQAGQSATQSAGNAATAQGAATAADASKTAAAGSATAAQKSAADAQASKTAAGKSETNAAGSATAADKSKTDAQAAQRAAESAKTAAESSATLAGGKATEAGQKATEAGNSATAAAGSAAAAAKSKTDAEAAKTAAQTAKTEAESARTASETAKTAAQTAQGKAEAARDAAGVSAADAADSSTAAGTSATTAAASAQTAIAKAGEASTSAGAAKTSETNAKKSETAAGLSADAAEQARQAIEALGVQGVTLAAGSQAAVEKLVDASGTVTLKFSIPQGAKGDKGSMGDRGVSISSIQRTAGNGAAGTTDTYTITLSDGSTSTFAVYNGRDGEGSGDMAASVYDPAGKSRDIFKYADDAAVEAKAASRPSTWKPTPSDIVREGYTAAGLDPIAAAMVGSAASNKTFGLPAEAITVEYSNDGGATWEDYGASNTAKFGLFAELRNTPFYLGKRSATVAADPANAQTTESMLRVTIIPTDRYTRLNAMYCWFGANGNRCEAKIERTTIGDKTTFTAVKDWTRVEGWTGDNIIYFPIGSFGGGANQTLNNYAYRVTYRNTVMGSTDGVARVYDIRFYGDAVWSSPYNMVKYNRLYKWDADLTAIFEKSISGEQLISRAAEGTPPLVVSSSTAVPKLNADLLDGHHAAYFTEYADKALYQQAVDAGYTGTEAAFYAALVTLKDAPFLSLRDGGVWVPNRINIGASDGFVCPGMEASFDADGSNAIIQLMDGPSDASCRLRGVADPTEPTDAAPKSYVDAETAKCLPLAGGTMTGDLNMAGNLIMLDSGASISAENELVRILAEGGNGIIVGDCAIHELIAPVAARDAANKEYVDSLSVYDVVIRTQAEFEKLIASPDWLGAVSVCFVGDGGTLKFTRSDGQGVKIPQTVKQIQGMNGAIIEVTNFSSTSTINKAALWYEILPDADDYWIRDLLVNCSSTSAGSGCSFCNCTQLINCTGTSSSGAESYGFCDCTQLTNCTGCGASSGESAYGFDNCTHLTNCIGIATGSSGDGSSYCFCNCTQLTNCTGKSTGATYCNGFGYCTCLANCIGTASTDGYGSDTDACGFRSCTQLTNCAGTGTSSSSSRGYGFHSCKYLNGCKQGTTASTTALYSNCTFVGLTGENQLVFVDKTVAVSAWAANSTYSAQGYGFRASVACTGVTASHRPDVAFGAADSVGGNFAPFCDSYAGGVYIYCKTKPTATITIPNIVCVKGA